MFSQSANIAKSESRSKVYFDYAERRRIYEHSSNIAKVESRSKVYFDYAETKAYICDQSTNIAKVESRSNLYWIVDKGAVVCKCLILNYFLLIAALFSGQRLAENG